MTIEKIIAEDKKFEERLLKDKIMMSIRAYTTKNGKLYRRSADYFNRKLHY